MRRTVNRWTYDIILVDRPIPDPMLRGLSHNLTELWYYRFKDSANITRVAMVSNHNVAVTLAGVSEADFLLVAEVGNSFHYQNPGKNFLDALDEALDEDVFIMGHILDRKDHWYELHNQCYVINVEKYKALAEKPIYTPRKAMEFPAAIRSPENFHDDYTPTWVEHESGEVYVPEPRQGADLIAASLRDTGSVHPFPQPVRDARLFLYPRKPSWRGNLSRLLAKSGPNRNRHYAFSYEGVPEGLENIGPLDFIACPCNGLNVFRYLQATGIRDGMTIRLFDSNPMSVDVYRRIMRDWNGLDYMGLFHGMEPMVRNLYMTDYWKEFLDSFGGPQGWLPFLQRVRAQNVHIERIDLLEARADWKWDVTGNGLFVTSNIYDFAETGLFYNTEHRAAAYQNLLASLPGHTWVYTIFPLCKRSGLKRVCDEVLKPVDEFPWSAKPRK